MNPPDTHSIQEALAGVNSPDNGGDLGQFGAPGALPGSPLLSAFHADLYVDGRFWATVQLPIGSPLVALAHTLSTESYRQSCRLQDDTIALDAAWTHVSLHLSRPLCIPGMPL